MATALLLLLLTVAMLGVSGVILMFLPVCLWCLKRCITLFWADAAWCVCSSDASSTALQKTLDYACGAGADCSPILQVGTCYNPNTVLAHCSYAANSYYQRNGQAQTACDFSGTAVLTSSDPSKQPFSLLIKSLKPWQNRMLICGFGIAGANGCVYPATAR